jgi:predicted transcriptional regulator
VQAAAASTGANWQEAARERARDALLRDPRRSNRTIAVAATVHRNTAGKVRRELEAAGLIGRWQDRLTPGRVHAAVTAALIRDAARTAMAVAEQTGANRSTVEQVRRELEAAGLIGRWRAPGYPRAGRRLS